VKAGIPPKRVVRLVRHVGSDPGSGLTLRGVMLVDVMISNHDAVLWQVVSSFVRALTRCVPTVETLFMARFYRQV